MIDRYVIDADKKLLSQMYGLTIPDEFQITYNAAPTKSLPVSTMQNPKTVVFFKWGLISILSNNKKLSPKLFNLPYHQAISKPSHIKSLESSRCIIWATGFYAWKPISKNKTSPYYIYAEDGKPFGIAGIWEEYESLEGKAASSFMMITSTASTEIQSYQEDMPMILSVENCEKWLSSDLSIGDISDSIRDNSIPHLKIHPVSPAIRNIELDSQQLIKPGNPTDQHGNYTLFG